MTKTSSLARASDKSHKKGLCMWEVTWHTSTIHNLLSLSPHNPSY